MVNVVYQGPTNPAAAKTFAYVTAGIVPRNDNFPVIPTQNGSGLPSFPLIPPLLSSGPPSFGAHLPMQPPQVDSRRLFVPQQESRSRSLSQGNKRKRLEDGPAGSQTKSANGPVNPKKKPIVGTLDCTDRGRKMKSPPADIFIWGVHNDTSIEDIVNDLADSGIKIETRDVQLKSKENANLRSYKISVPAAQLQQALDPTIWPLRVKVREWIYYSNRNKTNSSAKDSNDDTASTAAGDGANVAQNQS